MDYEVIIMFAAFFCGIAGMALAKTAKKKSSYLLLYLSIAMAVLTFIGLVAAVIMIFFMK